MRFLKFLLIVLPIFCYSVFAFCIVYKYNLSSLDGLMLVVIMTLGGANISQGLSRTID